MRLTAKNCCPQDRITLGSVPEPMSGCWIWVGGTNKKGYAHLKYDMKMWRGNRFSWEAFKGPIPIGLCVLHHCDNRLCVNPEHLFLGTDLDNARDRDAKGRHAPKCLRGPLNHKTKLEDRTLIPSDSRQIHARI